MNTMARRWCIFRLTGQTEYKLYKVYLMVIILCLWPGNIETGQIEKQCDRCQVKGGINCTVTELPYPCFLPESDEKDFPHQPREVRSEKHLYNDSRWHLHLSWKLPYDYSYSVVTGFEMVIDSLIPMAHVKVQPMRCFHINLNGVEWSTVDDVHNLEFKLDCLEYNVSEFTRNLVVTLYSLPKAAKNSDYTSYRLALPGTPSKNMWSPIIRATPNATGLMVKFSPPFESAAYHLICVENYKRICMGGMVRVNRTDEKILEKFIEVPKNQSGRIMVRPYSASGKYLDGWVTDNEYYFINSTKPVTLAPPATDRLNQTSTLRLPENQTADYPVYIILLVVAILLFLATAVIVFFRRKHKCTKKHFKFLQKFCQDERQEEAGMMRNQVRDKHSVIITPILLQQTELEKHMVEAHLQLLEKQEGISVNPTPFLSDEKYEEVQKQPEFSTWIDQQIKLALQQNNHYFIIYSSFSMKIILTEPDMFRENLPDQICVSFIKKLTAQNIEKKVLGVCFGNSEDYNCLPFTKFHRMFSAVRFRDAPPCRAVSFTGTIDLIKYLLASQTTDYSFSSDETNPLHSLFLRSQGLMSRSMDALTTGYQSDSELCPFIQDNGTFVSPDSIAGSQSDVTAEMNGVNIRAGWTDVC